MANEQKGRFTWIYETGAVVLVLIATFAVLFAVQEHKERVLSEEVNDTGAELQDTGAKIASIRDADLKEMNDYVRAYSELAPLLDDYDRQLQRITELYTQARQRDKNPLNVTRLYRTPHVTNWESMSEILDTTRR